MICNILQISQCICNCGIDFIVVLVTTDFNCIVVVCSVFDFLLSVVITASQLQPNYMHNFIYNLFRNLVTQMSRTLSLTVCLELEHLKNENLIQFYAPFWISVWVSLQFKLFNLFWEEFLWNFQILLYLVREFGIHFVLERASYSFPVSLAMPLSLSLTHWVRERERELFVRGPCPLLLLSTVCTLEIGTYLTSALWYCRMGSRFCSHL